MRPFVVALSLFNRASVYLESHTASTPASNCQAIQVSFVNDLCTPKSEKNTSKKSLVINLFAKNSKGNINHQSSGESHAPTSKDPWLGIITPINITTHHGRASFIASQRGSHG